MPPPQSSNFKEYECMPLNCKTASRLVYFLKDNFRDCQIGDQSVVCAKCLPKYNKSPKKSEWVDNCAVWC